MNRVVLAVFALLLSSHGCVADEQTTTMEERRLTDDATTMGDDTTSAAPRTGSPGTVLLALLAFLYVGSAAGAALDESTTMADEPRSGALGTMLLALIAFLFVGNAAGAAVDESTTMADERRLTDTTMSDDTTSPAAPRAAFRTAPLFALAAALGFAAHR
ncbi:unnamed protein product [Prorocentrum cordatum]|uniref:Uncharacterized protein n=1 Tax=Prorocentrum cordatum TaxID=2364126 RepID=A0ABN9UPW7_9DINO|nr:unnamed protein product [Polarella glacialis]